MYEQNQPKYYHQYLPRINKKNSDKFLSGWADAKSIKTREMTQQNMGIKFFF
jgi:hypothetical protein